jgi:hypothetical protein
MLGGPETVISLADGPCAAVSLHFLAPTVSTAASTAARYCAKQYQNVIQTVISKGLLNEYELKSLVVLMVLRGPFDMEVDLTRAGFLRFSLQRVDLLGQSCSLSRPMSPKTLSSSAFFEPDLLPQSTSPSFALLCLRGPAAAAV